MTKSAQDLRDCLPFTKCDFTSGFLLRSDMYSRDRTEWMRHWMHNSWRRIAELFPWHYAIRGRVYNCCSFLPPTKKERRTSTSERKKKCVCDPRINFHAFDLFFSDEGRRESREDPLEVPQDGQWSRGGPGSPSARLSTEGRVRQMLHRG